MIRVYSRNRRLPMVWPARCSRASPVIEPRGRGLPWIPKRGRKWSNRGAGYRACPRQRRRAMANDDHASSARVQWARLRFQVLGPLRAASADAREPKTPPARNMPGPTRLDPAGNRPSGANSPVRYCEAYLDTLVRLPDDVYGSIQIMWVFQESNAKSASRGARSLDPLDGALAARDRTRQRARERIAAALSRSPAAAPFLSDDDVQRVLRAFDGWRTVARCDRSVRARA
jgi:hypothetical protein